MIRFVIIGIVIAVAFTLFALVDAAMSAPARSRGVSKPVWIVLIVLLPVLGGILWFVIGKGPVPPPQPKPVEDDPRFTAKRLSDAELEAHMQDLEARLRELDAETFPHEQSKTEPNRAGERGDTPAADSAGTETNADRDADDSPRDQQ